MPRSDGDSLRELTSAAGRLRERFLQDACTTVVLDDLLGGSSLSGRSNELRGRSVLIATRDQLTTAMALIELDGVASRVVLCPPDLRFEHIPAVATATGVDALVSDRDATEFGLAGLECVVRCGGTRTPASCNRTTHRTEWVLLTSGTTGVPKMVLHTLSSLTSAIRSGSGPTTPAIWGTFYDIRRYGGLQILLRSLLDGGSLVLSSPGESTEDFLSRAGAYGVTHISGTPSHWRRALMSPSATKIQPRYVRLSGEVADQAILDSLRDVYKGAIVAHAFASTEAGVAFAVNDGRAGFPKSLVTDGGADIAMKVVEGSLRIRSTRTAVCYLGDGAKELADKEGFVDTQDLVELRDDRYFFSGRRDGVINVGGLKLHPEEVEAVINRHPKVRMSLVKPRRNAITGAIVVADVVADLPPDGGSISAETNTLKKEILEICRGSLAAYKVPATIRFVTALDVTGSGKLTRPHN